MTDLQTLQTGLDLSAKLARLLLLLTERKIVTLEIIEQETKTCADGRNGIHRLRLRLRGSGLTIQSKREVGYWLDAATRARLRDMIARLDAQFEAPAA